jgi:protein SCO1/2
VRKRKIISAMVMLSLMLLVCARLVEAQQSPAQVIEQVRFDQRINQPLPLEAEFRDEAGRAVKLGDYFGRRPVILALVYYECPMLCSLVLNGLLKSLRVVKFTPGDEFEIVVVSFDRREKPELAARKKLAYMQEFKRPGSEHGWHFLTGEQSAIDALTGAVGFSYTYDAATGQFAHASGILVATPEGKLHRYFYGIEYAPRDLRLALVDAAANKIGSPVDKVLLYCFHYDPQTGKYGVVITRVLRIFGSGVALLLFGYMWVMFRRERRAQHQLSAASTGQAAKS